MSKIMPFVAVAVWFSLFVWHPLWGSLLFIVAVAGVVFLWVKYSNARRMNEARGRIEPRFVISRHPRTGQAVNSLPEALEKLTLHVPYKRVARTVEEQKELLAESGNAYYADEALSEEDRLPVIPIIYQDGKHVNESWAEFELRAARKAAKVRARWHERLRQADRGYYMKYRHGQQGIEWDFSPS